MVTSIANIASVIINSTRVKPFAVIFIAFTRE
jgi:hypothetical protein